MGSSFHSPRMQAGTSSSSFSGRRGPVAPVSVLKLYRTGIKRRRGEGGASTARGVDANGNANGNDNEEESTKFPCSTPSQLCLVDNPLFSLPFGITELAGPAGVGKTQIALSLCADCVLQHQHHHHSQHKNKSVFIQLGGSSRFLQTASRRLQQIIESRISANDFARNSTTANDRSTKDETVHECLTRILVRWVCNSEELMELLRTSLPRLFLAHPTISIVVLDGIANLFRLPEQEQYPLDANSNFGGSSSSNPWRDRAVTFFQLSNLCKELSSRLEIPFVVLNGCTSRISTSSLRHQSEAVLEPALGLSWSQCVNCSFFVRRGSLRDEMEQRNREKDCNTRRMRQGGDCRRILQCLKAPHISSEHASMKFWIDRSGVIPI